MFVGDLPLLLDNAANVHTNNKCLRSWVQCCVIIFLRLYLLGLSLNLWEGSNLGDLFSDCLRPNLRPFSDPSKRNGCALSQINPWPEGIPSSSSSLTITKNLKWWKSSSVSSLPVHSSPKQRQGGHPTSLGQCHTSPDISSAESGQGVGSRKKMSHNRPEMEEVRTRSNFLANNLIGRKIFRENRPKRKSIIIKTEKKRISYLAGSKTICYKQSKSW